MGGEISIDLGSAIPYLSDRLLGLFHKDAASEEWKRQLTSLVRLSLERASWVQCVGMDKPIPIRRIYQPSRLARLALAASHKQEVWGRFGTPKQLPDTLQFRELVAQDIDAIVFAGPGRGKTTLLHSMYIELHQSSEYIPLLFTLRDPTGVETLEAFVDQLAVGRSPRTSKQSPELNAKLKNAKLLLLVDGYDEISIGDRRRVSRALLLFHSLGFGHFFLTCRTFYDVFDLTVEYFGLLRFSHDDSLGFIEAFSAGYGTQLNAVTLLHELEEHGFQDFASHPLLLALVCILKSGPSPVLPRRAVGLIRRAIDTLTLRWDEAKGIYRDSKIQLDGEERVRCLMRIAYFMNKPEAPTEVVERYANEYLKLVQLRGLDTRAFLREMAQWYGLLIEGSHDTWQFVHRTIQDYLAARFWVEDGRFNPDEVTHWDTRGAYAACLCPDASRSIVRMLRYEKNVSAFSECLYNAAPFNPERIAKEVLNRFIRLTCFTHARSKEGLVVSAGEDFFSLATPEFLHSLIRVGLKSGGPAGDVIASLAMAECWSRKLQIEPAMVGLTKSIMASWTSVVVLRGGEPRTFTVHDIIRHV